ncbi:MAG: hypothetical protein QW524_01760 [Candidatus Woesearchaeota archaeon]
MNKSIFKTIPREEFEKSGSWIIKENEDSVYILLNAKLFDKKVIFATLYNMQQFAYTLLDFDGKDYIIRLIRTNNQKNLEELALDFTQRLINFEHYFLQLEDVKDIKEEIFKEVYSQLQKGSVPEVDYDINEQGVEENSEFCGCEEETLEVQDEGIKLQPENIDFQEFEDLLKPWEERFKEDLKDKRDPYLEK